MNSSRVHIKQETTVSYVCVPILRQQFKKFAKGLSPYGFWLNYM